MSTPAPAQTTRVLTPLVIAAIVVTVLAWASAFVVIRNTAPWFSGGALTLGRVFIGAVLLSLLLIGKRWVAPSRREWLLITGFGVVWFGLYNIALNTAEQTLDAGTTAMLVNIGPILIALGAGIILREGIPRWLAIGAIVAFTGAIVIGVATGGSIVDGGVGIFWCLGAAVAYAAGVLFQKPALKRLPNAQVTWLGCVIGMIACLPFTGELVTGLQSAPPDALLGMLYLGAIPTALAFSTWAYALSRVPAGQLGVSTYIVPPIAVVLGLVIFAEVPAPLAIAGGALCLVGVALSRISPRVPVSTKSLAE